MNPITNSVVKEKIRQKHHNAAVQTEQQLRERMNNDINSLVPKKKADIKVFLIAGAVVGGIIGVAVGVIDVIIVGLIIGFIAFIASSISISNYNKELKQKKIRIKDETEKKIRANYDEADQKTMDEIARYKNEVNKYVKVIRAKSSEFDKMVNHTIDMFERMISHSDHGAHKRFVEADLIYEVSTSGIKYIYNSNYSNPKDDFNFNRERFRDLKTDAECEGLAQALARMTYSKMKKRYPPNSMEINIDHMDAKVTMHFQGANKNFVPAKDIL